MRGIMRCCGWGARVVGPHRQSYAFHSARLGLLVLICVLSAGCVAQSSKRMGVHNARDAVLVHEANPTEASDRLVRGTAGQSEYLGEPKIPVKVEEFEADLQELHKASQGLFGGASWLWVILGGIGSLATAVVAAWGGNWALAARSLIKGLTGAVETTGSKSTAKLAIKAATMGNGAEKMLRRWLVRFEDNKVSSGL